MLNEIELNKLKLYESPEIPEAPAPREMIDMETTFEKLENETREVNASIGNLRRTYFELQEMKHLLRKTQIFFDEVSCLSVILFSLFKYLICLNHLIFCITRKTLNLLFLIGASNYVF